MLSVEYTHKFEGLYPTPVPAEPENCRKQNAEFAEVQRRACRVTRERKGEALGRPGNGISLLQYSMSVPPWQHRIDQ